MSRVTIAFFVATLSIAASARADLIPPDVDACRQKVAGDRCDGGTCRASRCTKLDYAHWDGGGGSPPVIEYDCVRCIPGAAPDGGHRPPVDAAVDGAPSAHIRDAARDGPAEAGPLTPISPGGCDGSCALYRREEPVGSHAAALLVAALVPWLLRRRRTR